jgi:hypothetical protein
LASGKTQNRTPSRKYGKFLIRSPDCQINSESLCWLSYPGSLMKDINIQWNSYLSRRWLSGSPVILISLALQVNLLRIYKTNLPWNCQFSHQVQYSFMASITLNQVWSKGSDTGTYCKK